MRYHSHFSTTVIPSPKTPVSPLEIIAHGRLSTGVKKAHLFCVYDEEATDDKDVVTFFSLEWAGF